jgi:nitronate monooxygenase
MPPKLNRFLQHANVKARIIFGAMYPCSSPRYVAHCCNAGALGEIQPVSFTKVHNTSIEEAIKIIRSITNQPFAMNALLEVKHAGHSKLLQEWCATAINAGCRFFITALGDPKPFVEFARAHDARVYHKVTNLRHAEKALAANVDGLIATNNRAGGHLGEHSMEELYKMLSPTGLPLVCAGGIGDENDFVHALKTGYEAVLIGTRGIASLESEVSTEYKEELIRATAKDITTTIHFTGTPLSVINTAIIEQIKQNPDTFPKPSLTNIFQAGKSVDGIKNLLSVNEIVRRFEEAANINKV